MRFMVIVPASKESEAGILPDQRHFAEMIKFNEEMVKAGVMLAGEGLHPTSKGARIQFADRKTTATDGPFAETKELIAGYWLIQVKSKDEAIAWMKRAPSPQARRWNCGRCTSPATWLPRSPPICLSGTRGCGPRRRPKKGTR